MPRLRFRRKKKEDDVNSILESIKEDEETLRVVQEVRKSLRSPTASTSNSDSKNLGRRSRLHDKVKQVSAEDWRMKVQDQVPLIDIDGLLDHSADESEFSQEIAYCETRDSTSVIPREETFFSSFVCSPRGAGLVQNNDSSDSSDPFESSDDNDDEDYDPEKPASGWNIFGVADTSFDDRNDADSIYAETIVLSSPMVFVHKRQNKSTKSSIKEETNLEEVQKVDTATTEEALAPTLAMNFAAKPCEAQQKKISMAKLSFGPWRKRAVVKDDE